MKSRWLVLGVLGALVSGGPADPTPFDGPPGDAAPVESAPGPEARTPSGHRAEGRHFYVWQEDPEEAASWAATLAPLDRPARRPR